MEIIKLNLIPNGVNPTCHCSQYDEGRIIRIELFDGLTPYTIQSGDTFTLNVRKPDNTIVTTSEVVASAQGHTYIEITTTEQICACVGYNLCDLTITNGNVVIGTLNFIMAIERDVLADGIPSQSVIEDLDALVQEAVGDNYYTKPEVDEALALKADADNVYTIAQTDNLLSEKTDNSTFNTALDNIDAAIALKANSADVYTKAQIDAALALKADKSEVYNTYPTDTESGSIASFTDGADNIPVKSLIAQIVAQQAGSGDPSPSNVRAISGFTACNVTKTGKNLFNGSNVETTNATNWGVSFENNTLTIEHKTAYTTGLPEIKLKLGAGSYIWSYTGNSGLIALYINDVYTKVLNNNVTFELTELSEIRISFSAASNTTEIFSNIQLECGSTATDYEAYNGETKQISFGSAGTVYGGNLNVTTGLLTITHAYNGLSTLPWQQDSAYGSYFYTTGFSNKKSGLTNMICNKYANATGYGNQQPDLTIRGAESGNVHRLFIRDNSCADLTAFNTAIQGAMLCYEIETPQTVQLTPTEVKTLLGTNNIFADTGDVEVNYRADIGLYIDKKISQISTPLSSLSTMRSAAPEEIREDITEESSETPQNDEER